MNNEQSPIESIQAEIVPPAQMSELMRTEIDMQIATAKKYPRSLAKFKQEAMEMATMDPEIASRCFYKLKRRGKMGVDAFIEGPSVRLAEIVANAWGNLRFGARTSGETQNEVTSQGIAHDLEKNVCNTIEVSRRITTSDGRRFSQDMVMVTKNATNSIALRNAIFKTVPFLYVKEVYEAAKRAAVGDAKTIGEKRQSMVEAFSKMRVSPDQIFKYLEIEGLEDIGIKELETMLGVYNAIKDGDTTVDEQFHPDKPASGDMPKRKSDAIPAPQAEAPTQDQAPKPAPDAPAMPQEPQSAPVPPKEPEKQGGPKPIPAGYTLIQAAGGACRGCKGQMTRGETAIFSPTKGVRHYDCA